MRSKRFSGSFSESVRRDHWRTKSQSSVNKSQSSRKTPRTSSGAGRNQRYETTAATKHFLGSLCRRLHLASVESTLGNFRWCHHRAGTAPGTALCDSAHGFWRVEDGLATASVGRAGPVVTAVLAPQTTDSVAKTGTSSGAAQRQAYVTASTDSRETIVKSRQQRTRATRGSA